MSREKLLSISNAVALLLTLIVNWLANALPINGKSTGELSDMYPNLFVPAGFTFAIWGIIYLALLAFVIYQLLVAFRNSKNAYFIRKIGWWFVVSCIANMSWIIAWHYIYPGISLVIMLILLFVLIRIYLNLHAAKSVSPGAARIFVLPVFSIYLGWITVATIANVTAVLVHLEWNGLGITPAYWAITMVVVACLFAVYFTLIRENPFYALVILWALYGIYFKRSHSSEEERAIVTASVLAMLIVILAIVLLLIKKRVLKS